MSDGFSDIYKQEEIYNKHLEYCKEICKIDNEFNLLCLEEAELNVQYYKLKNDISEIGKKLNKIEKSKNKIIKKYESEI